MKTLFFLFSSLIIPSLVSAQVKSPPHIFDDTVYVSPPINPSVVEKFHLYKTNLLETEITIYAIVFPRNTQGYIDFWDAYSYLLEDMELSDSDLTEDIYSFPSLFDSMTDSDKTENIKSGRAYLYRQYSQYGSRSLILSLMPDNLDDSNDYWLIFYSYGLSGRVPKGVIREN